MTPKWMYYLISVLYCLPFVNFDDCFMPFGSLSKKKSKTEKKGDHLNVRE